MLIDTHSHIYDEAFDEDRNEVVERAVAEGVERIILPAIDGESNERLFAMCRDYKELVVPLMGLHPTSVNDNPRWREELAEVERLLENPPQGVERFYGVGEIGLDLYWSRDWQTEQTEAFRAQVELALAHDLPIVVHTRDAWEEMAAIVEEYRGRGLRGIFHAFSSDVAMYERLRECGDFLFGIGGVVTFKKSALAEVVRAMRLEDLVVETDAPYLTPAPHRGTRNESSYVRFVAAKIAELQGVDYELVAEQTTANAKRIFRL
ncbi:MAG: TatD family hydrolase [Alistipes sp.]|nr:TatD family hydrolase [Alistipes sp.]